MKVNGRWDDSLDGITNNITAHFSSLFKSNGHRDFSSALSHVDSVVSDEMNEELLKPVSNEEIK